MIKSSRTFPTKVEGENAGCPLLPYAGGAGSIAQSALSGLDPTTSLGTSYLSSSDGRRTRRRHLGSVSGRAADYPELTARRLPLMEDTVSGASPVGLG